MYCVSSAVDDFSIFNPAGCDVHNRRFRFATFTVMHNHTPVGLRLRSKNSVEILHTFKKFFSVNSVLFVVK
jgi:hypothetical protein